MGLLDKIKDLFVDEVVEDDEIELEEEEKEEYKKPKDVLPKVMRDNIAVNEKKETAPKFKLEDLEPKKELPKREPVVKKETIKEEPVKTDTKKFNFPLDLEKEYTPKRNNNVNVLQIEKEKSKEKEKLKEMLEEKHTLYPPKEEQIAKTKFKASPVISPVYGVLDKNYKKDEEIEKEEDDASMKRASKKVDFESVRKKAFGNLADDIKDNLMCENCELYKEAKRINSLKEDDLLYDMTVEDTGPVTIEKAYDNYEEFGVAYEPEKNKKKADDNIIINNNTEVAEASKIEIKEDNKKVLPSREQKNKVEEDDEPKEQVDLKKDKVDDDFFDLIDSMYKERNDE